VLRLNGKWLLGLIVICLLFVFFVLQVWLFLLQNLFYVVCDELMMMIMEHGFVNFDSDEGLISYYGKIKILSFFI
jgi:hypothetical protein